MIKIITEEDFDGAVSTVGLSLASRRPIQAMREIVEDALRRGFSVGLYVSEKKVWSSFQRSDIVIQLFVDLGDRARISGHVVPGVYVVAQILSGALDTMTTKLVQTEDGHLIAPHPHAHGRSDDYVEIPYLNICGDHRIPSSFGRWERTGNIRTLIPTAIGAACTTSYPYSDAYFISVAQRED